MTKTKNWGEGQPKQCMNKKCRMKTATLYVI